MSALFVGLLVLIVTMVGVAAYSLVSEAAVMRASDQLTSVARELASASSRSAAARATMLREIARAPLLRQVVSGTAPTVAADAASRVQLQVVPSPPDPAIAKLLEAARRPADSTVVGWYVVDTKRAARFGAALATVDAGRLDEVARGVLESAAVRRSVIYSAGRGLHVWTAVPIEHDGEVVGVLAELRRLASSAPTEGLLARLTGRNANVYFASRGSEEWGSIRGQPVSSPIGTHRADAVADSSAVRVDSGVAEPLYAAVASVAGTPWRIVLTQRESSILERPRATLRQMLVMGALLIVVGAIAAGLLIRFETRSLATLRRAADAMAGGDYTQVVPSEGAEETAALADAFNVMATRISTVHATLAQQNAALQRANDAKARFLAVMSHEMRTPLNAIGGYAELIALGVHGATTPAQRDVLDRIGRSKEQLLRLVTDILHYARLEATPLPVTLEPVALREQFDVVRETFAEQFERRDVKLEIAGTDHWLCADSARIQQVLFNLVSNALHFTETGGVVSLSAANDGERTVIRVSDTGIGIPAAEQASIFEPFVQADSSLTRRAGGVGLGLAIVQQLVTAMNGRVSVESAPGRGSVFFVALPSAESAVADCSMDDALEMASS